jgi:hypothetical protein
MHRTRGTRATGRKNDYWVRVTIGPQKMNGQWMVTHEHVSMPFINMETLQTAASAPSLSPRTWYGRPAYAKDGKVVCFLQGAQKFKTRYATFGFSDAANLDEDALCPVAFALKQLTAAEEAKIDVFVRKAVS